MALVPISVATRRKSLPQQRLSRLFCKRTDRIAKKICDALFENKYLTGCIAGKIIRILPPLVITKADVDKFIEVLAKACEEV